MKCGGTGEEKEVDETVQQLCEELKDEILGASKKDSFEVFTPLKFTSQVVAGTNYFVKIQVTSGGECVHVRIFKPLPHTGGKAELHGLQEQKDVGAEVAYFEKA